MSDSLLKHYETVLVFIPSLSDEGVKAELAKLSADVEGKFAGKVTAQDIWGRKTLAYPIHKAKEGIYALVQYESNNGKVVDGIEQKLRINETVLRYLTVNRETELKRAKKGEVEKARLLKKLPATPVAVSQESATVAEIPAPAAV